MDQLLDVTKENLVQISLSALLMYVLLIVAIKLFGKRSNSKLNSFDWIVTVSIGSLFASTVILKSVSFIDGAISILVLLLLQFVVTKAMDNSNLFRNFVKTKPTLLVYNGEFLDDNMKKERVLKEEIYSAIRLQGLKSLDNVYAVVLETDSKLSIIKNDNPNEIGYSLADVKGLPKDLEQKIFYQIR